jgi:hypothetical protein
METDNKNNLIDVSQVEYQDYLKKIRYTKKTTQKECTIYLIHRV